MSDEVGSIIGKIEKIEKKWWTDNVKIALFL